MATLAGALVLLAGCSDTGQTGIDSRRTLAVSAAASLTEPFTELANRFEEDHPEVEVSPNFAGSSQLAQQIVSDAPVDVFASANTSTMDQVVSTGRATSTPRIFARNTLEIAVPPGNPGAVHGLADFARQPLRLAVCLPEVPCGAAAQKLFGLAGVDARPDTFEDDVKAVLTKVELGEVDAGLVYRTDVRVAGARVEGIDFPEADQVVNSYPIVAVSDSPDASNFIDFVLSDDGRSVLTKAGFQQP